MRGAQANSIDFNSRYGIIPADAGSTRVRGVVEIPYGDHPRGCGEHSPNGIEVNDTKGSSPRMRGAHVCICNSQWYKGIIPADAGSTDMAKIDAVVYEDHPRGCGEHRKSRNKAYRYRGSSPRMRGARRA